MKIIIMGTAYPMRGGIAQFNSLMFRYLSVNNEVKFYSFSRQYPEFLFPGKTQYEQGKPAIEIPESKNVIAVDSVNPFNWIINGYRIAKENPDLLIFKYWIPFFAPCYFTISFVAKIFSKVKVLFICDNVIPHEKRFGDKFFTKLAFTQVDYFLVMSKPVEKDLLNFSKNCNYRLIPHPVYNLFGDAVSKAEAKSVINSEYGIDLRNDRVILFFGYVRKYKGLNYLIEAIPEILKKVDIKLLVVGEFYDDEVKYKELIKKLNVENNVVIVSDFIPDEKVKYFFSASDAVILPYADATQSGIAQIAYFYDKPVIATNVGGLAEVVKNNETGFVIEAKSSKAISDAVIQFYEGNFEENFAEKVKEEKKNYSWEKFASAVENF